MSWRAGWYVDCAPKTYLARSSLILPAGAYYWEVTVTEAGVDGTNGYGILAGVCNSSFVLTGCCATAVNPATPNEQHGAFFSTHANNAFSPAPGQGYPNPTGSIPVELVGVPPGVYGLALDTINNKLWYRNITDNSPSGKYAGGSNSNGEPENNLHGADISASGPSPVLGPVYPMFGASHGSGAAKGAGTVNFGASAFTGTAPTGFVSPYSVFPQAALNPDDNSNLVLSNGNLSFDGTNVPVTFSPAIDIFTTNVGYSSACRANFAIAQT